MKCHAMLEFQWRDINLRNSRLFLAGEKLRAMLQFVSIKLPPTTTEQLRNLWVAATTA